MLVLVHFKQQVEGWRLSAGLHCVTLLTRALCVCVCSAMPRHGLWLGRTASFAAGSCCLILSQMEDTLDAWIAWSFASAIPCDKVEQKAPERAKSTIAGFKTPKIFARSAPHNSAGFAPSLLLRSLKWRQTEGQLMTKTKDQLFLVGLQSKIASRLPAVFLGPKRFHLLP